MIIYVEQMERQVHSEIFGGKKKKKTPRGDRDEGQGPRSPGREWGREGEGEVKTEGGGRKKSFVGKCMKQASVLEVFFFKTES